MATGTGEGGTSHYSKQNSKRSSSLVRDRYFYSAITLGFVLPCVDKTAVTKNFADSAKFTVLINLFARDPTSFQPPLI